MTATTLTVAKGTTVQGSFGGTTYRDITDDLNGDQMYLFKYLKISAAPIENHTHAIGVRDGVWGQLRGGFCPQPGQQQ